MYTIEVVVLNMQALGDKQKVQEEEDLKDEKVSGKPKEDVSRTNRQDSRFGCTAGAPEGCKPWTASIKSLDANFH